MKRLHIVNADGITMSMNGTRLVFEVADRDRAETILFLLRRNSMKSLDLVEQEGE